MVRKCQNANLLVWYSFRIFSGSNLNILYSQPLVLPQSVLQVSGSPLS